MIAPVEALPGVYDSAQALIQYYRQQRTELGRFARCLRISSARGLRSKHIVFKEQGDVMRTALLLALVCFISCGSQAQSPVTTSETFMLTMHVLGNEICFSVEDKELDSSPEWLNPESDPPPFAIAETVRISRAELNKYVGNPEEWRVSGVELRRFERRAQWFYVVEWRPRKPGHVGDGVSIPILMNGRAVVGKIRSDPDTKRNSCEG